MMWKRSPRHTVKMKYTSYIFPLLWKEHQDTLLSEKGRMEAEASICIKKERKTEFIFVLAWVCILKL